MELEGFLELADFDGATGVLSIKSEWLDEEPLAFELLDELGTWREVIQSEILASARGLGSKSCKAFGFSPVAYAKQSRSVPKPSKVR